MRVRGFISFALLALVGLLGAALMVGAPPAASAAGQAVALNKSADTFILPLAGGPVTFTYNSSNFIEFELTSINDDLLGELSSGNSTCVFPNFDSTYSCTASTTVTPLNGDSSQPHQSGAIATFRGEGEQTATAFPVYIDFGGITATKTAFPTTLPTAGGEVTFTFGVANPGSVDMSVDTLIDDKLGDLNGQGDCSLPQILAVGASYSCSLTTTLPAGVPGTPHVNTLTASASQVFRAEAQPNVANLQASFQATADASATVEYLATGITATKVASPTSVPEAGGDVTFTYGVTNVGDLDMIVDALVDDKLGDLAGQGDCAIGQTVAAGTTYTCTVTKNLTGTADTPHVNTFTANATSVDTATLEENTASATAAHQATAMATVNFLAAAPTAVATAVPTVAPTATPAQNTGQAASRPITPPDPTAVPTPAPTPAVAAAPVADEAEGLAFTSTESTLPAAIALSSISAGAVLLGWLRRREDRR